MENLLLASVFLNLPFACNLSRYPLACRLKSERPSKWLRDFSRYPPCLKANNWSAWVANPLLALPFRYAWHSRVTSHDIPLPCRLKTHLRIMQSAFRFNSTQIKVSLSRLKLQLLINAIVCWALLTSVFMEFFFVWPWDCLWLRNLSPWFVMSHNTT